MISKHRQTLLTSNSTSNGLLIVLPNGTSACVSNRASARCPGSRSQLSAVQHVVSVADLSFIPEAGGRGRGKHRGAAHCRQVGADHFVQLEVDASR
jgi:hypothetical protein